MTRPAAPPDAVALIAALPAPLAALAARGVPRLQRKGSVLMEEGEHGDELHIILSGSLRVFTADLRSARELTYGVYGPGEYVGELGLDGGARSATVMALEPSLCVRITRQTLLSHLAEHPDFALVLLAKVIARVRAATLGMRQVALNDVYGRLKLLLESLPAGAADAEGWVPLGRLPHRDIAARAGCSREMISRLMKDLERAGRVRTAADGLQVRWPLPARW